VHAVFGPHTPSNTLKKGHQIKITHFSVLHLTWSQKRQEEEEEVRRENAWCDEAPWAATSRDRIAPSHRDLPKENISPAKKDGHMYINRLGAARGGTTHSVFADAIYFVVGSREGKVESDDTNIIHVAQVFW
jgi:hypothetical protein